MRCRTTLVARGAFSGADGRALVTKTPWLAAGLLVGTLLVACSGQPVDTDRATISLPLHAGWVDGKEVRYVTTDVSEKAAAQEHGANYVPRLAAAVLARGDLNMLERVYWVTNFSQRAVFQSSPAPVGPANTEAAYSPLWRIVRVLWKEPGRARELRSEAEVLAAEDRGQVTLERTNLVANCPIVSVRDHGVLPGASWAR